MPIDAATAIVAPGEVLRLGAVGRAGERDALAQAPRQRRRRRGGRVAQPDRGAPVELGRDAPQRADEQPQRAALLGVREHDLRRPGLLPRGALLEVGAGVDHGVVAGEVALDEVARGGEARGAPVEPPEQELDHLARHLGRDEALGGRVEGADVERARVAERGRRRAGRERLVHVQEVELGAVEQLLERGRHVERQRHRPAAAEGQRLPHGDDRSAARVRPERVGVGPHRLDRRAPVPDQLARVRRRDTTTRWPRAHSSSESRSTKRLTS